MQNFVVNRRLVFAAGAALLLTAWMLSGLLRPAAPQSDAESAAVNGNGGENRISVRVRTASAQARRSELLVRGRTEAVRAVQLRAEVEGTVVALPVVKGSPVKEGDIVCELALNSRAARLEEARAAMKQRELEYSAAKELSGRGFRSETQMASARAALDAAKAALKAMEIEIENTKLRAPFDGILDERGVEIGDFMRVGDICGLVIDEDPFLVVGQVSERDIGKIKPGAAGTARLVTGERIEGRVRFIAKQADAATRTFRVELEVPNPDGLLRAGVTSDIVIPVEEVRAHRFSPALLSLNDQGVIGVRIIEEGENGAVARFKPVTIVSEGNDGVWVTGLPTKVTVITVGQDYVSDGQRVTVVREDGQGDRP